MVSVELKIDGVVFSHISIWNTTGNETGMGQYEFEATEDIGKVYRGFVMHKREDGAFRLVERTIHEALCEKRFQEAEAYKKEKNDD